VPPPITQNPPRDEDGFVTPHDHGQIRDADALVRYIAPVWIIPSEQGKRLSSAAFKPSTDKYRGLSLDHKEMILYFGQSVENRMPEKSCAVACVQAGELRKEKDVRVGWDPLDSNPAHCNAWGLRGNAPKRIAKSARWREIRGAGVRFPK